LPIFTNAFFFVNDLSLFLLLNEFFLEKSWQYCRINFDKGNILINLFSNQEVFKADKNSILISFGCYAQNIELYYWQFCQ